VNHRWLGGMLTNWKTISNSIKRLRELDAQLSEENVEETSGLTKKELLNLNRERDKLERALGGIKDMGDLPNILVVVDTNKEHIAVAEANKLEIPVIGVIDSNSDPDGITFPIPGNDDAFRAISTYCNLMADAVLDGIQQELISSGADVGEAEEAPAEDLPEEAKTEAAKTEEAKVEEAKEAPAEEPKAEEPKAEEAKAEEAKAEEAKAGQAKAGEAKAEEAKQAPAGEPKAEEPKAEEAKAEEAKAEPEPEDESAKSKPKAAKASDKAADETATSDEAKEDATGDAGPAPAKVDPKSS
jgi:ribosomal protein S2